MIRIPKRQISLMLAVAVTAVLLMITAGVAMTRTSLADNSDPASEPVYQEFTVWARQFDFTPAVITVQQGDHVRVNLKTADVAHGWYVDGYDINIKVSGGDTTSVEFVADKAGTYKIRCSVTCGPFHPFLAGKLVVQQSPNIIPWLIIVGVAAVAMVSVGGFAVQLWWKNRRNEGK